MKKNIKNKKICALSKRGITIIEFLVVFAILGILVSIVIPQYSKTRELQVLKNGVQEVLSSVDKARGETLSSLDSSSYGVHFQLGEIMLFKGTVFSANDPSNEIVVLDNLVSITNVTLGGVSATFGDMYFNRLSGAPSASGTVTVSTDSYSKIITISATGMASVN